MEPHTIIQVTPATPSSTDSSSKTAASNMLDNLLDELQTFSKQSIDIKDTASTKSPFQRVTGSFRIPKTLNESDTIIRKGEIESVDDRSKD